MQFSTSHLLSPRRGQEAPWVTADFPDLSVPFWQPGAAAAEFPG
jgi:hypothetical protein